MKRMTTILVLWCACAAAAVSAGQTTPTSPRSILCLDGSWLLATDPRNEGVAQEWFTRPVADARPAKVPWIIQDAFPGYHGLAWYWRDFELPTNPHPQGRYLLRFWAVDYKADVWLNGKPVGSHEGGETPFTLDVTGAISPFQPNRIAVRVLNPTHTPIDGIVLGETPHRNKALPYSAGSSYNHGGIVDSVELLVTPALYITDVYPRPDSRSGKILVKVNVHNSLPHEIEGRLQCGVAQDPAGSTIQFRSLDQTLAAGDSELEVELEVENPRLWDVNEPNLYRVAARVQQRGTASLDEMNVRCGFRDFRFEQGYFRLNGRRLLLRCSHTGNHCPIGLQLPPDSDMLRRDLLNVKVMGFNAIRFIAGMATRYQLDLCDEIGLMVYEEHYGSWVLGDSPRMPERYDRALREMIMRDRSHPSIVMWGLLNETSDGPVFRHAAAALPLVRSLDDSRMVMLNSGRWDQQARSSISGLEMWRTPAGPDPNVTRNRMDHPISGLGVTWQPGQFALHPGPRGEYSVARWTVPAAGEYQIEAVFAGIAQAATTDVHVMHNGVSIFDGGINLAGQGNEAPCSVMRVLAQGDHVDFVVGMGNGFYGGDTTALAARLRSGSGLTADVAADFHIQANPSGPWQYGSLAAGASPDVGTFVPYPLGKSEENEDEFGTLCNPGSQRWENVLGDQHPYQRVPHTEDVIQFLRTVDGGRNPIFVSEYGVGSAVDLWRVTRHYERRGKEDVEDAQFYRDKLDRFLVDWDRWRMDECFSRPEEFFAQSMRQMAAERLYGMNALRANPRLVGYSLTGTVDQGMSGEGLSTTFRELKPGTIDAMFDAWAPLRLCLFAQPTNVYRGAPIKLEALLANEDMLSPGEYPVRLCVIGPDTRRVFDRLVTVEIPPHSENHESPWVIPILSEEVTLDLPAGTYRFLATFERGAAPAGGDAVFHVDDPATMPPLPDELVLWGDDARLRQWLDEQHFPTRPFSTEAPARREVILVGATPHPGGPDAWRQLIGRAARGAAIVFLSPHVFRDNDNPTHWLPLKNKGTYRRLPGWLYHEDQWAKRHGVFDALPCGGLMDYSFYRQVIPNEVFAGQDPPLHAIAAANDASFDYSSGLIVAEYELGAGRFLLNTLLIRENLGASPVAERLLRNMLLHAASEADEPLAPPPPDEAKLLEELGY